MSGTATDLKDKFKTIDRLLYKYEAVFIHVNTAAEGVTLPEHLRTQPSVTLKLSRLFRGALNVSEEQISAELLFSGEYFTCLLPLHAIWGVTTQDSANMVWPESAPPEVLSGLPQPEKIDPSPQPDQAPRPVKGRPQLRRVK